MSSLDPKDVTELSVVKSDEAFRTFIQASPSGIALVPEAYGDKAIPVCKVDGGDFVKWLGFTHPEIKVSVPEAPERLILRSSDHWLPLVWLASDVVLPVYLNLVASYLYDRMKGALKSDKHRISFSAEFEDKASGTVKRFDFSGDAESLQKAIKSLDRLWNGRRSSK